MNFISYIIRSRQFFLTLWFLAYFIWVQPIILTRSLQAPEQKDISLGLILVGVQVLELIGTWLKYPSVYARVQANRSRSWLQLISGLLVLTHIMITALLAFTTLRFLGLDLDNDAFIPGLVGLAIFFAALIKEGFFLGWWFQLMGMKGAPLPSLPETISPTIAEIIGDGFLSIFSALAYTIVWEQTAASSFIVLGTTSFKLVLEYLGAAFFFLLVFPATRSLYYTEELLTQQPRTTRWVSWAILLITMLAALSAIPKG